MALVILLNVLTKVNSGDIIVSIIALTAHFCVFGGKENGKKSFAYIAFCIVGQ